MPGVPTHPIYFPGFPGYPAHPIPPVVWPPVPPGSVQPPMNTPPPVDLPPGQEWVFGYIPGQGWQWVVVNVDVQQDAAEQLATKSGGAGPEHAHK
jgi:hypothetical protein